jgi:bla regulator protein blaR1
MKPVSLGTALWLSVYCVFGQAAGPQQSLSFEVASIKSSPQNCGPAGPCPSMIRREPGGGMRVAGMSLKMLIGFGYNVREFQIIGGPSWINTERFDINAKGDSHDEIDSAADPAKLSDEQRKTALERERERLRNLLADRFQLAIRREMKEQQVYALVVAKSGRKLQESKEGIDRMRMGRGMLSGNGVEPAMLANALSQQLGRPVIDKTGLTGKYDIDLKWTPDTGQSAATPFGPPLPGAQLPPPPDPNGPSIFTALTEQLGLRLESEKAPAEVLVIDRVEKPSEN